MKLFEKIPASFFSILASPNRELYWTALVTLHHLPEYDLNIPIEDYCIALGDKFSEAYTAKPECLLQGPYLQDSRGASCICCKIIFGWNRKPCRKSKARFLR